MLEEAREAPEAAARLLSRDGDLYVALGANLRADPPRAAQTNARGR